MTSKAAKGGATLGQQIGVDTVCGLYERMPARAELGIESQLRVLLDERRKAGLEELAAGKTQGYVRDNHLG